MQIDSPVETQNWSCPSPFLSYSDPHALDDSHPISEINSLLGLPVKMISSSGNTPIDPEMMLSLFLGIHQPCQVTPSDSLSYLDLQSNVCYKKLSFVFSYF